MHFVKSDKLSIQSCFKTKSIAASCGFTLEGKADEFTSCSYICANGTFITGRSQCGGVCGEDPNNLCPKCSNGAVNPPACNQCGNGSTWNGTGCTCNNLASNAPECNICPSGLVMQNNQCVCANGALNPMACNQCPIGSNMTNGVCTCNNNADVFAQCNACKSSQAFDKSGTCRDSCNTTNVCGQTITGFMNNGTCSLEGVQNPNESCILDFNVTTNTVNPNGSVEFSWSLANLPSNIKSKCGFVDLTTSTPRPIPGLQNLDPNTDRVRINNVQSTTRFCLVCQYYNLLQNNALLGEAVKHQWVRVIKVGEN